MEGLLKEEEGEKRDTCTEKNLEDEKVLSGNMSRKDKRKVIKKLKRKQMRKETAEKEREEEETRLNDPEEQRRVQLMEQEEVERIERERKEFEERERAWIEAMEMKMKEAAEEEQRKLLEETHKQQQEKENESNQDDEWDYVEEGPAEIIWQGNEIIFKKKKVRIPRDSGCQIKREDANRPTSNPLPPDSEVFADYTNSSTVSAQQVLENVAQQVPNFGTEQDKAHCPFHLKTGACRFGQRCSRVHFYPDKSCTLLMKNMYNGPGLAWEQDEGLEYTDEEVERSFEEFYEDVHTEFLKFGEIVNFKVCKNGSFHLRGNVYVQYKSLDSALLAYNTINGRYFAGKQIRCEFVNLTRWKVAICGEYMKSGFKTCSHGTACNFIHCFHNPGGDYEWADFDKPPPKYWVKNMSALFGYSDDHEKLMEQETLSVLKNSSKKRKTDSDRRHSRRSRSREMDGFNSSGSGRRKREDERKQSRTPDEELCERNTNLKDNHKRKDGISDTDSNREWLDKEGDREKHHKRTRKCSINRNKDDKRRSHDGDSDADWTAIPGDRQKQHGSEGRNSRQRNRDIDQGRPGDWSDRDRDRKRHRICKRKSSSHRNRDYRNVTSEAESDRSLFDRDEDVETHHDCSRKSSKHRRRSGLSNDYEDYENKNEVDGDWSTGEKDRRVHHHYARKSSKHHKMEYIDDHGEKL